MSEGGKDSSQFDVDSVVNQLQPAYESNKGIRSEDIRNNLTKITTKASIWEMKGASEGDLDNLLNKGLNKIREFYPQEEDGKNITTILDEVVNKEARTEEKTGKKSKVKLAVDKHKDLFEPPKE